MTEETTDFETFYRWVSDEELEDFRECGELRPDPGHSSYEFGKPVFYSVENAREFGRMFGEYPDRGSVIEIEVDAELVDDLEPFNRKQDGIGPAWMLTFDVLEFAEISEVEDADV